ncbi:Ig-like domain-containing protein [Streptomyces cellostaticus]|uniref:Ig-like domain-containing protein n=1 Tax=Streptomyces cellostaticus TaxID=67285 RepID=UPI000A9E38B1|nr:Ig-like domain-containing protein [Streptomyces cellostaticus]GHI03077.1 hypothetical protein Scel_13980 [Streptomyces cellostaticus]
MGVPQISNRSGQQARSWSRRGLLAALGAAPATAALAGCGSSADASASAGGTGTGASSSARGATTKKATIAVTPAAGTKKAGFTSPVEVTVTDGTLASVQVTGNDGSTLAGTLDSARTKWTSVRNPCSGTKYTVTAKAEGAAEASVTTFTTRSPGATFAGCFTPEADSTSGVGMPVSVNFTHAVTDRAAVQKAITVTAEPAVEVVGHRYSATRLDFRPRTYWAPGTKYTVTANAEGAAEASVTTFTTRSPGATFAGCFTPEADSTSGVGMPVSVNFTHAVTDRAAVQKAITVTAEPAVEVVGHRFSATRLDFRPRTCWAPGTKITLSLRLKDVEGADGVFGIQHKDVGFTSAASRSARSTSPRRR